MTILLDFDGTLVDQNRLSAFRKLVERFAVHKSEELASHLCHEDIFLCRREIYDRTYLFRLFAADFPGKSPLELCTAFWDAVQSVQTPLPGCEKALIALRSQNYRLACATDTDGPGSNKRARVESSSISKFFNAGIFIGSENGAPPKGEPAFIDYILKATGAVNDRTGALKENCVMVGDKAQSDLLPAHARGISTILVRNPAFDCKWPVVVNSLTELPSLIQTIELGLEFGLFVSYCHDDSHFVERIEAALQESGVKLWRDVRDIGIGENWERRIFEAIKSNAGFLVVLTQKSIKREWVKKEIKFAVEERIQGRQWIFPVVAEDNVKSLRSLKKLQHANCSGENFSCGIEKIVKAIREQVSSRRIRKAESD